ncbi:MAG TPA: substrate-binding domain-containing protein [Rhodanobacteraceae bacterium]|nr:substrate-binding domain-containing protein [Rhodanobacteraceae bacterium]
MSSFRSGIPFLSALLCVVFAAPADAGAGAANSLIWRGDIVTARGYMDDLAKLFEKTHKGRITLQPFSTISGLDAVAKGSADLAGSARGRYAKRALEANIDFIPVALDAIVAITYRDNPASNITLAQLRDVYLGKITNWQDLGGKHTPINLYAIAAPLDGVEFSLRALLFRNGDQRVAAPRLYLNTAKLEEGVALDPSGFGLSTLSSSYANQHVKMLSVEGIAPSTAHVADGSYPLFMTLYLGDDAATPNKPEADAFLAFIDTPKARQILRRHQLVPYAEAGNVAALDTARLAHIDTELFAGAPARVVASAAPGPVAAPTTASTQDHEPASTIGISAGKATADVKPSAVKTRPVAGSAKALAATSASHPETTRRDEHRKAAIAEVAGKTASATKPRTAKTVKPKKASFDNVEVVATTRPEKASFANVKAAVVTHQKTKAGARFDSVSGGASSVPAQGSSE